MNRTALPDEGASTFHEYLVHLQGDAPPAFHVFAVVALVLSVLLEGNGRREFTGIDQIRTGKAIASSVLMSS